MCAPVAGFRSRVSSVLLSAMALALIAPLHAGCGSEGEDFVSVGKSPDAAAMEGEDQTGTDVDADLGEARQPCDRVEVDGDLVVEREQDFTASYRIGEPYDKTIMLFGGEPVEDANALSNAYVIGLDKTDALQLAEKYPDFHLCSSPGGQEAAMFIAAYDLVPASCQVYDQILAALRTYTVNLAAGGDRTSLRLEGALLQLESVTEDATGQDVTEQVGDQDFHLVTAVEQLTGQSVLDFGSSD